MCKPSLTRRFAGAAITGTDIEGNRLFRTKLKLNFSIARPKRASKLDVIKKWAGLVKILPKLTSVSLVQSVETGELMINP